MKNELENVISKVNKLEKQLKQINKQLENFDLNSSVVHRVDFLNYSCIEKEKLKIAQIKAAANNLILFDCAVEIMIPTEQEVELAIIVSDISIQKIRRKLAVGVNNISINQNYLPKQSKEFDVFIEIIC